MNLSLPAEFDPELLQKWQALVDHIAGLGRVAVAFSGGVDSGLLATAAYAALGEQMLAVTIHSPVDPPGEVEAARTLAEQVGFAHRVVEHDDLEHPQFVANPPERCYHCKLVRLGKLQHMAAAEGYRYILEGSNASDAGDYRPGKRAVEELGVLSPLAEVGLVKAEIRSLAHALGLAVAERPSAPCLATRFPYGTPISTEGIRQVAEAEAYLTGLGFQPVRVRHYGALARIEVAPQEISRLTALSKEVSDKLKGIGFTHVAVDLTGYRSGSMNEVL